MKLMYSAARSAWAALAGMDHGRSPVAMDAAEPEELGLGETWDHPDDLLLLADPHPPLESAAQAVFHKAPAR